MRRFLKIFVLALLAVAPGPALAAVAPRYELTPDGNAKFLADYAQEPNVVKLPDGLMYQVITAGKGTSPLSPNDEVSVEYRGWRIDGAVFDQTQPRMPRTFQVGGVIPGWTEALMKMKAGDTWLVVIPASLAYGDTGVDNVIPPGQTLIFTIKLTKVAYAQ
jgi:FKBP-type peptidyl-prolyl cis-trans isomerase FklB